MRCFLFTVITVSAFAKPLEVQIETPHAILMNAKTGAILYEKNAKDEVFPASTTKVASVLFILKSLPNRLHDLVKCSASALKMTNEQAKRANDFALPAHWLEPDGTSANLVVGEEMTVKDLLFGAMLASGNDAANVLAEYVCKDIPTFMKGVNDMAQGLGCIKTCFMNPHGLHHPMHKTCAYDMAILTREALKYPAFKEIVSCPVYRRPKTNKQGEQDFVNANALIKPGSDFYYPKAFGVKTGRTKLGKYNLVAAAKDGDRELILVLHKSANNKQRFRDAFLLFEKAFHETLAERVLYAYGDTAFARKLPKAQGELIGEVSRDVVYRYYPSEEEPLRTELHWFSVGLPVLKGQKVAELRVKGRGDRLVLVESLFAAERVDKKWFYKMEEWCIQFTRRYFWPILLIACSLFILKRFILPRVARSCYPCN